VNLKYSTMKDQILDLNHVSLHVRNLETSVSFYRDKIGLPVLNRPDFDFPGAWFRLGIHQELHLIAGQDVVVHSGSRSTHFALQVKSIQEVQSFLEQQEIPFKGPKERPDGALQIFFIDPDGYYIECCQLIE
jgi:lactoylglutathione lyase